MPFEPRHILITGASSGIGAALAEVYAMPGASLHLCGRDKARLDDVVAKCQNKGAAVSPVVLDVTDQAGMRSWIESVDSQAPLDLVVANAGMGGLAALAGWAGEDEENIRKIIDVNINGVINTFAPVQPRMVQRGHGMLVIISSINGWRGLPDAPAYGASKAAVKVYGESLRPLLSPHGVDVCVVLPGYVVSRMSDSLPFARPFLVSTERAAKIIQRGLARRRGRISFPWPMAFGAFFLSLLPVCLIDYILARTRMDKNAKKPGKPVNLKDKA